MDEDSGESGRTVPEGAGRTRRHGLSTRAVHAGEGSSPLPWRPAAAPIFQTAPWSFASVAELEAATRRSRGVGDGLARYSCGIEDGDDLVEDLARGLDAAQRAGSGADGGGR